MSTVSMHVATGDEVHRLRPLLERTTQKPYRFLVDRAKADIVSFWLHDLEGLIRNPTGELLVAESGGGLVGMAARTELPWESAILGARMSALKHLVVDPGVAHRQRVGEELLESVTARAVASEAEFMLCKAYSDDSFLIHLLEAHGFSLMDTLLDYVVDVAQDRFTRVAPSAPAEGFRIRLVADGEVEMLEDVARAAFTRHFGRFHADERIPPWRATELYVRWIRSCCEGFADWILVAERDGRLAGYSAWRGPSSQERSHNISIGHYSIGAVHPDFSGQGLFAALTFEGMRLLKEKIRYIEGPTHINNYPVQRGYTKLGWRIEDARHSFHKWLIPES